MQFAASDIVAIIVAILFSMGLHEAMHAFTAHWLGDPTAKDLGRLTLNPFKHIDIYMTLLLPVGLILLGLPPIFAAKPVPFNPTRVKYDEFGAALIGVAGPLTNLLLAIAGAGVLRAFNLPSGPTDFVLIFVMVNIAFFVFNMIPIPPLDGSRLLYAVAPEPLQKVLYQIEGMGFLFLIVILVLFIPVLGPVIAYVNDAILTFLLSGTGLI
ncbi:MAG TPA: site-2 protease family protein [Candidatus Limnocylindria bacterium]|nr:site-2 protease family protein [Candidatus Limnocylindria bacterium]